ncbi:ArnT family glycosyltransferase [Mycolicibacterium sp. J2]|uniref:ArnT family glycosyltransferase n=1 Tax=Mycolicibacterium sp. J2 TaxID=2993511 RepID=UPI003A4E3D85
MTPQTTATFFVPPIDADPDLPGAQPKNLQRWALPLLLVGTAVLYLWHITVNGMGNQFYAAAAQAGSQDWEALLFGSLDARNFITVDKPPVSQWVMGLSGQLFGFSSASMLVPEALMAVGSVALLYGAVRRVAGPWAGLLAGAALALTPVAVLMFRFNNPDAAMVLLMTAAAYCAVRALERHGARWMVLAGVALGFAFLAKMLEGLMVMPAIGVMYLVAAPVAWRSRLLHLLGALVAFVVSAGWYVVLTLVWPASSRPYLAGSTDNNFMNLVLGYNGFGRVLGHNNYGFQDEPQIGVAAGQAVGQAHRGMGGWGDQQHGLPRLFTGEFGYEIGWLLLGALLATVLVLISRGRAPRTDIVRAGAILFGGWLLIDGLVLSFMKTNVHPYYCMSLAPAVAAMFAIGVAETWRRRDGWFGRIGLAVLLLTTGGWSCWILGRNAGWLPPLRWVIVAVTVAATLTLLWALGAPRRRGIATAAVVVAVLSALTGSAAYSLATVGQPHTGGGPSVGPAHADSRHGGWGQPTDNADLDAMLKNTHTTWSAAINRSSAAAALELSTGTSVMAIGGFIGSDPVPTLSQFQDDVADHQIGYYILPDSAGHGAFGRNVHTDISDWVKAHFTPVKVGTNTVYDLTAPKAGAGSDHRQ